MPNQIPYDIVNIESGFQINGAGKMENVKIVYYKTVYGDTGDVKIPVDMFTAELAKTLIDAEVKEIAMLRGMK